MGKHDKKPVYGTGDHVFRETPLARARRILHAVWTTRTTSHFMVSKCLHLLGQCIFQSQSVGGTNLSHVSASGVIAEFVSRVVGI